MPASLNDNFYPILLAKMDEPVTDGELEAFFRQLVLLADDGIQTGKRYVVIVLNDPVNFSAAARKKISQIQARHITPERNDVTLAAFNIVDSALARGAFTALQWIAPTLLKHIRFVPTYEVALSEAFALLEAEGTPFEGDRFALRQAIGRNRTASANDV